jgi:homoserine dehydrogenase
MGYAERDPSADVEGHDACRKIAILSSIISGKQVDFEDIYTEGITEITLEDIQYAKAMDMKIKLLASCKRSGDKLCAIVAPHLVSKNHPLYNIEDVFNAIFVKGNMLGDSMFYGSGAGKLPTASAVVGDIVEAAKNPDRSMMATWDAEKLALEEKSETMKKFFVRVKGTGEALKVELAKVFGKLQIIKLADVDDEFGFITDVMSEGDYEACAKQFPQICHMIRVEGM